MVFKQWEAQFFAAFNEFLSNDTAQCTNAADVGCAFGNGNSTACIQEVERVAGFEYKLVSRQGKTGVFNCKQAFGLFFVVVELAQEPIGIAVFEVVGRLFDFVLMINVAISDDVTIKSFCPNEVVHIFHALQIHGKALDTVGDFAEYRGAVDTADLLEVGAVATATAKV